MLDDQSTCDTPPIALDDHGACWQPARFDKAVVLIIDALRYDFTVPVEAASSHHYLNALTVLHETATRDPQRAVLRPFIADPPTTTLQRLKALTTGTLPTFVDAGSNFAGTAIAEDNLIAQLATANKTVAHLGDDTWHALFPGLFAPNLTHAYDSFNVWDLHTVDNGVEEHLFPLLAEPAKWDVLIGHFLGLDHAGHRYGPDHPATAAKLRQMDALLRRAIDALSDDKTVLVVMGDHGMDAKGDHGGESDDEVEAALWLYSKQPFFGRLEPGHAAPPPDAKTRPVAQIDLVPTLALLLGLPIPFNNLGAPIPEAFIGADGKGWGNLADANALAAAQIERYQRAYAEARGLEQESFVCPRWLWENAAALWREPKHVLGRSQAFYEDAAAAFADFQREHLRVCRSLWASFDVPSMAVGIAILALGVLVVLSFAALDDRVRSQAIRAFLRIVRGSMIAGGPTLALAAYLLKTSVIDATVLGLSAFPLIGYTFTILATNLRSALQPPISFWHVLAAVFTLSQAIGFASNSYTIWEDRIALFFLATFGLAALAAAQRRPEQRDRVLGAYHAALFAVCARVAAASRLCREEQMPHCCSTYYASATSSTSAVWQLVIPFGVFVALPAVIRSYYQGTRSYEGSAALWNGVALPAGLLGGAVYWTLDAADNGGWFGERVAEATLKTVKVGLAQTVLALAFAAGTATFIWAAPCVRIDSSAPLPNGSSPSTAKQSPPKRTTVTILGYANAHGARYHILLSALTLGAIFVQKPMGAGALFLFALQTLSLLELVDALALPASNPIAPVVLALLAGAHFFATGHQATLASIQWDAAFLASRAVRYPWSPLLVVLNTYGAQVLGVVAVPLVVLWKKGPKEKASNSGSAEDSSKGNGKGEQKGEGTGEETKGGGLLEGVAQALAWHVAYYAVLSLATTMWAGWLRRHLMLYRIFSPRFMTGAAVLVVVDLVGILVALAGVRGNTLAVADVFGWA